MHARFWGVRGSVASSGPAVATIGGNTSCLEVTSHGHRLIFDAGTGLRALGAALGPVPLTTSLFFSHLHWDHVQGFPFFTPAFLPGSSLELYGPSAGAVEAVLRKQMEPPNFPVPLAAMRASLRFFDATPGVTTEHGPFRVTPLELPHPQGCLGYVIEADGQRLAYCTDVELEAATMPPSIRDALDGVDALVLDAQYTRAEYEGSVGPSRRGWGHSTNLAAADIAARVNARRLWLFHHDPGHDDAQVEAMADEARAVFRQAAPAREGVRLDVGA